MNLLTILGIASLLFVAAFTWRTYSGGANPRAAIIEAWVNIAVGFTISFTTNFVVFPMVGASISAADSLWITWIYTVVSIVRQYVIRRWFQRRLHEAAMRLAGATS